MGKGVLDLSPADLGKLHALVAQVFYATWTDPVHGQFQRW